MATPEIVGAAEAADILGIGNTNFSHLRKQREGTEDAFPDPLIVLKCGPIWLVRDVKRYAKTFTPGRRAASTAGKPTKQVAAAPPAVAKKVVAKKAAPAKKAAYKKLSLAR